MQVKKNGTVRRHSSLHAVLAAIVLLSMTQQAPGQISKADLRSNIEKRLQELMVQRASQLGSALPEKQVAEVLSSFSAVVDLIPQEEVSDQLADWITISLSDLLLRQVDAFLAEGDGARRLLAGIEKQGKKVLSGLDAAKVDALLERRDELTSHRGDFQRSLLEYTVAALSKVESFRLDPRDDHLLMATCKVTGDSDQGYKTLLATKATATVEMENVNAKLLTLTLVWQLASIFRHQTWAEDFGFGNLFSRAYEPDSPLELGKLKRFHEVKEDLDLLYAHYFVVKDGVVDIDAMTLRLFVMAAGALQVGIPRPGGPFAASPSSPDARSVIFRNDHTMWSCLHNESSTADK